LTLDQLIEEKLKVGFEIAPGELKILKNKSADGKIKQRSLEWLMMRPRSEKEFRIYLRQKNVSEELVDSLTISMTKSGLLSGINFTRWFVGVKNRQLKSNKEIVFLLRQKGIPKNIIQDAFQELECDDKSKLEQLITKKSGLKKHSSPDKLITFLVRKGYSFSDVKEALTEG
jgi:regulatory protein